MPTDLELISSFVNLSADARQVLLKLNEFVAQNKTVTWELSGGVEVSADSLPKMVAGFNAEKDSMFRNFERNFGGVVGTSVTRSTDGIATAAVITYASGNLLELTLNRTAGVLSSIAWALKTGAGATLQQGTSTITRNSAGQIISVT